MADTEVEGHYAEPVRIVAFDSRLDRSDFTCGEEAVDAWFRQHAGQSERAGSARTFVAVRGTGVLGFYSSVVGVMLPNEVAEAFGVGRARYPKPAILLAQMGVDRRAQGKGLGSVLLVHALRNFLVVSERTGVEVVLVDALTIELCAFYRKMGFRSLEDHPLRLFMPMKVLRATFLSAVDGEDQILP